MGFLNRDPIDILLSLPAIFLAMSIHEFAHALAAYRMGDITPKLQGRLTLDPLAHVDWIGLIFFALFGFGWAKPVQINPLNFRNRRIGQIIVAVAGPLSNIALSLTAYVIFVLIIVFIPSFPSVGNRIINNIVWLNIVFAILNLLPIPPFDGYHILKSILRSRPYNFFMQYEKYGMLVLIAFVWFGVFDILVGVPARYIYSVLTQLALFINIFI